MTASQIASALAETLAETNAEIIEGHAYARMMGFCDLHTFELAVSGLVRAGLATSTYHVLRATPALMDIYAQTKGA